MALNVVNRIDDRVAVKNVLVSTWDKTGLETFVPGLKESCPGVTFFSTGGTFRRLESILGSDGDDLRRIAEYTGQPEMQGGLVKTLDFKIYLGLLGETYNEAHREDLARTGGVAFDLVVVNLYPFEQASSLEDATVEISRSHIDIGGPCMVRAAAKNFLRVASVVDPDDYPSLLVTVRTNAGKIDFATRFRLAKKAFGVTAAYDRAIAAYLGETTAKAAAAPYAFTDGTAP
jgi:phosphoribosylaminoimidazolecarboxamide formyltransferase/IMP cyclohydrolase